MVGWWVLALLFHSETLLWLSLSAQTLALPHPATPSSRTNLLYPHRKLGRTFPRPHIIFYSWYDYSNSPWNRCPWSLPFDSPPPLLNSLWPGIHPHYSVGADPVKIPMNTMGGFNHDPPASGLFNHGSTETLLNSKTLRLPKRRGGNSLIAPQIWFHCTWSASWYDLTSWDDWAIQIKTWAIVQQIWAAT